MSKLILKWLAAALTGAAVVGLQALGAGLSVGPGVDPVLDAILVAAAAKLVSWLISKVPSSPN